LLCQRICVHSHFHDFLVVYEKRIGILVDEISGRSMSAVRIASMLKIARSALTHAADPARMLLV
jgi:hypothetical protein